MRSRNIQVNGSEFAIGQNVRVNKVEVENVEVQWRISRKDPKKVQLRNPINGSVTVFYDVLEPVVVAAYFPFVKKPELKEASCV